MPFQREEITLWNTRQQHCPTAIAGRLYHLTTSDVSHVGNREISKISVAGSQNYQGKSDVYSYTHRIGYPHSGTTLVMGCIISAPQSVMSSDVRGSHPLQISYVRECSLIPFSGEMLIVAVSILDRCYVSSGPFSANFSRGSGWCYT